MLFLTRLVNLLVIEYVENLLVKSLVVESFEILLINSSLVFVEGGSLGYNEFNMYKCPSQSPPEIKNLQL